MATTLIAVLINIVDPATAGDSDLVGFIAHVYMVHEVGDQLQEH